MVGDGHGDRERDCFVCKIFNMPRSGFHILFSDPAVQKLRAQTLADRRLCLVEIDRLARSIDILSEPGDGGERCLSVRGKKTNKKNTPSAKLTGNELRQPKHTTLFNVSLFYYCFFVCLSFNTFLMVLKVFFSPPHLFSQTSVGMFYFSPL